MRDPLKGLIVHEKARRKVRASACSVSVREIQSRQMRYKNKNTSLHKQFATYRSREFLIAEYFTNLKLRRNNIETDKGQEKYFQL